jgi:AmiR/NasT family two-component response regulator
MAGSQKEHNLSLAISARDVIGQAKGILMERHGMDADAAFDTLSRASQRLNIKLRDLAERLTKTRTVG